MAKAFECYPDKDYCVITVPHMVPEFMLLQQFVVSSHFRLRNQFCSPPSNDLIEILININSCFIQVHYLIIDCNNFLLPQHDSSTASFFMHFQLSNRVSWLEMFQGKSRLKLTEI